MKAATLPLAPEATRAALTAAGLAEDHDLSGLDCRGYTLRSDISDALADFKMRTGFTANIFRVWPMSFVLGHRFADVELKPAEPVTDGKTIYLHHCETCTCRAELL